jgi:hypothetical protein
MMAEIEQANTKNAKPFGINMDAIRSLTFLEIGGIEFRLHILTLKSWRSTIYDVTTS